VHTLLGVLYLHRSGGARNAKILPLWWHGECCVAHAINRKGSVL